MKSCHHSRVEEKPKADIFIILLQLKSFVHKQKSYLQVVQELHMYHHNTSAVPCQMKNLQEKGKRSGNVR